MNATPLFKLALVLGLALSGIARAQADLPGQWINQVMRDAQRDVQRDALRPAAVATATTVARETPAPLADGQAERTAARPEGRTEPLRR